MSWEKWLEFYRQNKGKINGAAIGFVFGCAVLIIGFFRTLFLTLCVVAGYFIGRKYEEDNNYFKNLLERVLPHTSYR